MDLKDPQDKPDHKEFKDPKDPQDHKVFLDVAGESETKEFVVPQDLRVPLGPTDLQDLKEFKDLKDQLEQWALLDRLESRVILDVRAPLVESVMKPIGSISLP